LSAKDELFEGSSQIIFRVDTPPRNGKCEVTSQHDWQAYYPVDFACLNWEDDSGLVKYNFLSKRGIK
jgi:hypothetical protein